MADDNQGASPKHEPARLEASEDAKMRAARRELKQSSISDPPAPTGSDSGHGSATDDKAEGQAEGRPVTPAGNVSDAQNAEGLKDRVSSPKKRAHDQLAGDKDAENNDTTSVASSDSARDRTSRLEPEKKRHRDEESGDAISVRLVPTGLPAAKLTIPAQKFLQSAAQPRAHKDEGAAHRPAGDKAPQTSSSAFAASGFGKLAQGSSAFAALGAARGATSFGASSMPAPPSSSAPSRCLPASQPAAASAAPKLTFGSNGGASPFAGLSSGTNGFRGRIGSGFGSALLGARPLSSFGASGGKPLQSGKAAKPFGAPDSDSDNGNEDADDDENDIQADEAQRAVSPERDSDDRRKTKLHKGMYEPFSRSHSPAPARPMCHTTADSRPSAAARAVEVDDGEAGEATVVSVRAKMFSLDKEAGWKERGAGMLKINVPRGCVELDETGVPVPGSFDASGLEADDEAGDDSQGHRMARLIMRQDQTHRVILNTAIVPAMKFQEKTSLKSVGILFTAFEGEEAKPVSVTMRMSAANAKNFMKEIEVVQKELRGI